MLDEPTNHLDIRSKDILKRALLNYEGTLIIVSHDRDFLDGLVNKLYEFRDGHLKEHLCDINEFMRKRKLERLKESRVSTIVKKEEKIIAASPNKSKVVEDESKKVKQLESKIKKAEDDIAELEKKISETEKVINQPDFYEKNTDSSKVLSDYQSLKSRLEEKFKIWEGFSEELNRVTA